MSEFYGGCEKGANRSAEKLQRGRVGARKRREENAKEEMIMRTFKIALCQQKIRDSVEENFEAAAAAVRRAAEGGAEIAILPEMFICHFIPADMQEKAQELGGSYMQRLSRMASENGIWLVGGSFPETAGEALYNTCPVFSPDGKTAGIYRKRYLFDVDIPGKVRTCESTVFSTGNESLIVDTGFAKIGVALCFDIRFPQLFIDMAAAGADLIAVPSAFSFWTGPAHWELLNRARAVDAQVYVAGVDVAYREDAPFHNYGCSRVCDPWGDVIAGADRDEELFFAEIDPKRTEEVRQNLIVLRHQPLHR